MRILARSLIVISPAVLAGYLAWLFLPCQPNRSIPVPAGTKLVEFSPAGRYVVTCQWDQRQLTLWSTDTGQVAYEVEIPLGSSANVLPHALKAFYGFSANDCRLAVATGNLWQPRLLIVDLISSNAVTPVAALPPDADEYWRWPRPAFSSDGQRCAFLYDLAKEREQMRKADSFDSLGPFGPPTRQGKWLVVNRDYRIELWDVAQKRRESTLPSWPVGRQEATPPSWPLGGGMNDFPRDKLGVHLSLTPDEQAVTALCFVWSPSRKEHIALYCCDLSTGKCETGWEYELPPVETPLWDLSSSDPIQFLLINTTDDDGRLVQDLLEVATGKVLARYPEPIDMLENVNLSGSVRKKTFGSPGLTRSLGRTGQMAIDAEHRVIVSKQISRDSFFWDHFGTPLGWLGIRPGPPRLGLQFHSAETGRLLQRVSLQTSDFSNPREPTLALHPSQPLLAAIDEDGSNSRLQFWRVPPPRPWAWIAACGLAAAACSSLAWIAYSKARKRKSESTDPAGTNTKSLKLKSSKN
jgi:WD40 repeat protein